MLKVFLLGNFKVEQAGMQLPDAVWSGRKVRNLFVLLTLAPEHRVSRQQLIRILWPELEQKSAEASLSRTLYLLRRLLEPGLTQAGASRFITRKKEWVCLEKPDGLWLDVEAFEELVAQARLSRQPLAGLKETLALYRGNLLQEEPYDEWLFERRLALEQSYNWMLNEMAARYRQLNDYPSAIKLLERCLAGDNTNENIHRDLMLLYTLSGQRHAALQQYKLCQQVLQEELGLNPTVETTTLYRQIITQQIVPGPLLPAYSGPSRSAPDPVQGNLPAALTSLIGRRQNIVILTELMQQSTTRLLTLTGPGGVGKTRLALALANEVARHYPDGVYLLELEAVPDPTQLSLALARTLKIPQVDHQPIEISLKNHLQNKQILLLLDKFEHLKAAAGLLTSWLVETSGLKIIVTTRTALRLPVEHCYEIKPLALPLYNGQSPSQRLGLIAQSPAIELFVERSYAVRPDFKLNEDNAETIAEVCRYLDGVPLSLELAAACLKVLSEKQLLIRLRRGEQLLLKR